jgi:signal transduction histidine kinase
MIRNGQRASEVVRRLRALSRKSDPAYAPVSLVDVVNDVALLIGRELQVHRATLSVNTTGSPPPARGDRVQLQQVVMNLLMNGMQAMDGVSARPRRLAVEVGRSAEDPKAVVLSVSDAGPGIDPASLGRLFDAFFTTRHDGMGMGLSICRSIVEAHGGRIWAVNREGGGASFHVSLPIAEEGAA